MAADYLALARISKYTGGTWKVVHTFDPESIVSLRCRFLGYRVEDTADLELLNRGSVSATASVQKLQDIAADLLARKGVLYRLDIFAGDTSVLADSLSWPTAWTAEPMIYWSGIIEEVVIETPIRVRAVGWTTHLHRVIVADRYFYRQTLNAILSNIAAAITSAWPGTLSLLTRTGGTDVNLILDEAAWKRASAHEILSELARFGNFFFGVSCSGYPAFEAQSASEFRLVFYEPHFEQDKADVSGAATQEANIALDIGLDERIVQYAPTRRDGLYANRWDFRGEALYADVLSIVVGYDADEIRDNAAFSTGNDSGVSKWEPGGVEGWRVEFVDKAVRNVITDAVTGAIYEAGRLESIPASLIRADGDVSYFVFDYSEVGTDAIFNLGTVPSPGSDLSPNVNQEALRYRLNPSGAVVNRIVRDRDTDYGSVAREEIVRIITDGSVRGYLHAGLYALQDHVAERMQAFSLRIKLVGWSRVPNGSRNQFDNLVKLQSGSERMTLFGTVLNGGDAWKYGDDTRPVGLSQTFEIRAAECEYGPAGWTVSWDLGAAPRNLAAVTYPSTVRGRGARRY